LANRRERFTSAAAEVAFNYSSAERARLLGEIRRRRQMQERARRWASGGVGVLVFILCSGLVWWRRHPDAVMTPVAAVARDEATVLDDGSRVSKASVDASWVVRTVTPDRMLVELTAGRAYFSVARRPEREFVVAAGEVRVIVVGTRFWVALKPDQVSVEVESGQVRVAREGFDERRLSAGEAMAILRTPPPTETTTADDPSAPPKAKGRPATRASREPTPVQPAIEAAPSFEQLVKEGEAAQRERRWADANRAWGRAVRDFPTEARRSPVAFMRAKLLLNDMGDASAAAEAFAGIEALGAPMALVEDALAREVEAWVRASAVERARERAQAFVRRFPASYRRAQVVKSAGLGVE
jgi:hypothetical protein